MSKENFKIGVTPTYTTENIERRAIEVRAASIDSRTVTGYAALFNSASQNLGGFIEYIDRDAFNEALPVSDVRALFNHNDNYILARSSSGTLQLEIDERGLKYTFEAPNTTAGNDLLESLKRGDISQSSFGFTVDTDNWEYRGDDLPAVRTITKVKRLYDVSPVTFPAFNNTTVAIRKLNVLQQNNNKMNGNTEKKEEYIATRDIEYLELELKKYGT